MPNYNGNTYLLTNLLTWEQAQAQARSLGGNLVTINSQAEQDWLVTTFGGTDRFWIGLTDNVTEGQFKWASNETSTYTNWFPGQPDNGGPPPGEDYVVMNFGAAGKWNDFPSNNNFTFRGIIEITSSTPTITLEVSPSSVLEDGTTNLTYIFTRTGATTNSLTVSYSITGTATSSDYTGATPGTGKTITFAAGSSTAILTIDPTADTTVESDETVVLTLASGTGYTVGTTTAVTGTITNDDSINITTFNGTNGNDTLTGGAGNDILNGGAGNDILNGGAGNDTLDGGAGIDTLIGGTGNDIYIVDSTVDSTTDTITENPVSGTDTIQSSVTYTIAALTNIENLTLTGTAAINGTGNAGNNVIIGNSVNNNLNGGAGNDTLDGGTGTDTLIGGAGNDIYVVDSTSDTITELVGGGTDTIQSSVTYNTIANLVNVENLTLTGTAAINGTGNTSNNTITGNSANNTLNGGAGTDTLIGGAGDDIYVVDSLTDTITELVGGGTDTIQSSVTYTIAAANVENLTLIGTTEINGTGNAVNNVITGNSAKNILDGGAGIDTLTGGLGDDIYVVDTTTDTITELVSGGTDTIQSSVTYTIAAANVENLTLTGTTAINGTGNAVNNVITGNSANNILDGGAGIDTLTGGAGDDIYVVDTTTDIIRENALGGTDTIQSSVTYTIAAANVENLTLTGTTAINGTGNAGDNTITGNSANNTLDGGAGNDTLIGGAGDDTYVVDSAADTITENVGEGTDTVQSSVNYTIPDFANVENLILTGTATDAIGNAGNNSITGNIENNTLDGGAGDDTLIGGLGDDIYVVDSADDIITENADEGTDTVTSSVSFNIAEFANVENLTLVGTATDAIGNAGNNSIIGNSANNTIDGGLGNDSLDGGDGDDTYIFTIDGIGLGRDIIIDGSGVDTISFAGTAANIRLNLGTTLGQTVDANTKTKVVLAAVDAIENAIGGDGNDRLIGNSLDNTLEGGLGNDILNGSTGNDFLFGGDGNDLLTGGDGDDTLKGGLGSNNLFGGAGIDQFEFSGVNLFNTTDNGVDIIADFTTGIDKLVLSKTVFDFLSSDVGGIGLSDTSDFDYVDDDELAGDSNARIVYSVTSGSLFYNQDGATAGFGTGGEFAVLDIVAPNDFVIIA
jgi:Ca2+-binding RTX toxin-like protein